MVINNYCPSSGTLHESFLVDILYTCLYRVLITTVHTTYVATAH